MSVIDFFTMKGPNKIPLKSNAMSVIIQFLTYIKYFQFYLSSGFGHFVRILIVYCVWLCV